jgi:REP element-mobilizing transposase RayT
MAAATSLSAKTAPSNLPPSEFSQIAPPVAAVYDRRKSTTLTETPQDKPVRCSGGLRPPEENEFAPLVAAVCDRRMKNETGAHRDAATEQSLQKPRLRRLDRVFVDSPIYFITACSVDRRPILDCEPVHDAFRTFCLNSPQHGAWIGRYVLMPDHLHLFLSVVEISLSNWLKSLKNALSKTLRTAGQEGPHWQKGFFDHLLRSRESYSQKWDYVRENPVRAGLVAIPEDWPFAGEIHDLEYRK